MSEIAKASGVTKSLIHHHFGSKDALWDEVKRTRFATYYDQQLDILKRMDASADLLEASMRVYFEFLEANPRVVRLLWWMSLSERIEAGEMMEQLRDLGVARIEAAQEAGLIRKDIEARYIFVAFVGVVHAWFTEGAWVDPGGDPSKYLTAAWQIFAAGVLPRGEAT